MPKKCDLRTVRDVMRPQAWSHDRKCFYKYMTVKTAEAVLGNGTLRWALPKLFNDPFDVQFDLQVKYDRDLVVERALTNIIDLYMGRRHVISGNKLAEGIKLLRKTAPRLKEADLRERFRKSMYDGLEKAERNMPRTHAEMRAVLGELKMLCFSEVNDNILMWAHYGKDHTGAVLEFSCIDKLDSAWGAAKPIRYRENMPVLVDENKLAKLLSGEGTIATPELFEEAVFVKANDWQYEREWRLVGGWEQEQETEFIPFQPEEMTAVYLGCRISDDDRAAIKMIAAEKYPHAAVYNGSKSATRFAVNFSKAV
jgi:hypothetical protein